MNSKIEDQEPNSVAPTGDNLPPSPASTLSRDAHQYYDEENTIGGENEKEIAQTPAEDFPDGGYGWLVVVACFFLNFNTWGANSAYAIYLSTYLNEGTFEGADKYDYALIGGLTFGVGLLFAPVIAWLQGKIGIKTTIMFGMCFQFASLLLASFAKKLWQLYLTQGVLQAFGLAFMSMPAFSILPQWFKKKRTFASALSAAGAGCGGIVYNLGMQKVIEVRSVAWALRAQAILCFGISWISILLIRTRMQVSFHLIDTSILKTAGAYIAFLYCVLSMFGYVSVLYNMANFTTSMGYSEYQGSIASAMVQVGSVLGRPTVGRISDYLGPVTVTCLAYFLAGVFVFGLWVPAKNYAMIIVFCILLGGLMGSIFATFGPVCAKLFGLKRVSNATGLFWLFIGIAGIVTPVIEISLKKDTGSKQYLDCAIFAGAAFFACSATLLIMRGYVIYRHENADCDADEGHMHIRVPLWAPFVCALKPVSKV